MASITEDVELAEVLGILALVALIGYALYKAGGTVSQWIDGINAKLKSLFDKISNPLSGLGDFFKSGSGNQSNDNSVPPNSGSEIDQACRYTICTGIGG